MTLFVEDFGLKKFVHIRRNGLHFLQYVREGDSCRFDSASSEKVIATGPDRSTKAERRNLPDDQNALLRSVPRDEISSKHLV